MERAVDDGGGDDDNGWCWKVGDQCNVAPP